MVKCKGCGFPKEGSRVGVIWLSNDGYCSVCNVIMRDRERKIIGMDKFVKTTIIKEGKNLHLDSRGAKLTLKRILHNKIASKNKAMNIPSEYKKALNKGKKTLEAFL